VYEKDEEAIREKSWPERQLLLVIRRLDLAEKQEDARTCPKVPRIAQRGCCRANPDLMSESHSEPDVELVRDGRNSRKESKKAEERKKR